MLRGRETLTRLIERTCASTIRRRRVQEEFIARGLRSRATAGDLMAYRQRMHAGQADALKRLADEAAKLGLDFIAAQLDLDLS